MYYVRPYSTVHMGVVQNIAENVLPWGGFEEGGFPTVPCFSPTLIHNTLYPFYLICRTLDSTYAAVSKYMDNVSKKQPASMLTAVRICRRTNTTWGRWRNTSKTLPRVLLEPGHVRLPLRKAEGCAASGAGGTTVVAVADLEVAEQGCHTGVASGLHRREATVACFVGRQGESSWS